MPAFGQAATKPVYWESPLTTARERSQSPRQRTTLKSIASAFGGTYVFAYDTLCNDQRSLRG
jgi:hypothetical protein